MRITPFIRELTAEEAAAGNVAPDGTFVGAGQTLREIRELHGGDEFDLPVVRLLDKLRDRYGDRPVFASPLVRQLLARADGLGDRVLVSLTDFADRDPDLTYLQVGYLREYTEGELQLLGLDDLDEDPPR